MVKITPFEWQDPATLEPLGMDDSAVAALEDVDPNVLEWVRQALSARDAISETAPAARPLAANDNAPPKEQTSDPDTYVPTIDPADWQGEPIPERDWYVDDLIPMRTVTLLSGDGGTGKSLLAMQMGIAGALGVETLGLKPRTGRVFYVACEDDKQELHIRTAAIVNSMGRHLEQLRGKFLAAPMVGKDSVLAAPDPRTKRLTPTPVMEALVEKVAAFRPDLVVLDTSADLFGGNEIDRVQVRQFIGLLRQIAIGVGCAVVLLSHPSVAGITTGSGLSGSTAWNNSVRSRLYLTADKDDPDARVLTAMKSNYAAKGRELRIRWQDGAFVSDDGKASPALGLLNKRHDDKFRELLSATNRTGQKLAPTAGVNYAPARLAERPDAEGTTKKQFEGAMQRLLASEIIKVVWEGPPSKQRQRLIVSAEDFGPGGVLHQQDQVAA